MAPVSVIVAAVLAVACSSSSDETKSGAETGGRTGTGGNSSLAGAVVAGGSVSHSGGSTTVGGIGFAGGGTQDGGRNEGIAGSTATNGLPSTAGRGTDTAAGAPNAGGIAPAAGSAGIGGMSALGAAAGSNNAAAGSASVGAVAAGAAGTSPSDGLVAWYPFNGDATDETGNGHDATVVGATLTTDRFGKVDRAFGFDGSGDYLEARASTAFDFGYGNFSYSLWVSVDTDINIQGGEVALFDKAQGSKGGYQIALRSTASDGYGRPMAMMCPDTCATLWATPQDLRDGKWHMLAFVRQGDGAFLYIDGTLNAQGTGFGTKTATVAQPLWLGETSVAGSGGNGEFKGKLDDIRIYSRALSADEIAGLFNVAN